MTNPQLVVNLWGHLSGGFGLGEGARATARALEAAGVHVQWCDLPLASHANSEPIPPEAGRRLPAAIDLIHTNPNVLRQTDGLQSRLQLESPLRLGFWAWELEAFPHGWERGFAGLDQIWCPSSFTATSLGQRSPVPVTPLPHLLNWARADRLHGLRQSAATRRKQPFTCLFAFDFWSTVGRKNPEGVITAFQQAFPRRRLPWQPGRAAPDLGRINPAAGLARIVSPSTLGSLGVAAVALGAVTAVAAVAARPLVAIQTHPVAVDAIAQVALEGCRGRRWPSANGCSRGGDSSAGSG